jgi:hypothetical protein
MTHAWWPVFGSQSSQLKRQKSDTGQGKSHQFDTYIKNWLANKLKYDCERKV